MRYGLLRVAQQAHATLLRHHPFGLWLSFAVLCTVRAYWKSCRIVLQYLKSSLCSQASTFTTGFSTTQLLWHNLGSKFHHHTIHTSRKYNTAVPEGAQPDLKMADSEALSDYSRVPESFNRLYTSACCGFNALEALPRINRHVPGFNLIFVFMRTSTLRFLVFGFSDPEISHPKS